MSEIEKLMLNAGIKKQYCGWLDMGDLDCQMRYVRCNTLEEYTETADFARGAKQEPVLEYPEFTAEKQLELVKFLSIKYGIYIVYIANNYSMCFGECLGKYCIKENLDETLAESINHLWQDLTEEEKAEIKRILE